jgi:general L-amino acid transport system substrate-binding protein
MQFLFTLLVLLAVCFPVPDARAGSVVERVKARGVVRCSSVERPGLAHKDGNGRWTGLNVDVCRAIAAAVLGSPEKIEYGDFETLKQVEAILNQQDDVYFLTGLEINALKVAGKITPGPAVFVESHSVMVPSTSPAQHVGDLAGKKICFMIASTVERSLHAYFDNIHKELLPAPFSEDGEMNDSYNVQNCDAVADETTTLAMTRLTPVKKGMTSRILPETLSAYPVIAATGTGDAQWSAIVAWTVHTLVSAERPETKWYAGGAGAMPVYVPELGLDKDWQRRAISAVGNYSDIFERNLGKGSQFRLDRGLNANQAQGGLLLSPFLD